MTARLLSLAADAGWRGRVDALRDALALFPLAILQLVTNFNSNLRKH